MMLNVMRLSHQFMDSIMMIIPTKVSMSATTLATPLVMSSVILSISLVALLTTLPTSRFA